MCALVGRPKREIKPKKTGPVAISCGNTRYFHKLCSRKKPFWKLVNEYQR